MAVKEFWNRPDTLDDGLPARLDPLSNVMLNRMFMDMTTAPAMLEFINAVLTDAGDTPIREILDMTSEYHLIAERPGYKEGRLDVRVVSMDGELYDVEVQLERMRGFHERLWFYGSRMISESIREGEEYTRIPKVRMICLCNFTQRPEHPDFLQPVGLLYKKEPAVATDVFRLYSVELPKFNRLEYGLKDVQEDPLRKWLYLFTKGYKNPEEMEALSMTEGMRVYSNKYNHFVDDPRVRHLYEAELASRRDIASIKALVREESMAEGRSEGKILGVIEDGLLDGLSDATILGKIMNRYALTSVQAEEYLRMAKQQGVKQN